MTRDEAFDVLAAVGDAEVLLASTDFLVVLLELEEADYLLFDRLFPEAA